MTDATNFSRAKSCRLAETSRCKHRAWLARRSIRRRMALANELVEAKHQLQLQGVNARRSRYELIAIDEVGYVPLALILFTLQF